MPEQLTKHPAVTLEVLRSAGAQCGAGAEQAILTSCPAERFCKLPGGEICVYGLADAARMTQLKPADWQALMPAGAAGTVAPTRGPGEAVAISIGLVLLGALLAALLGWALRRRR